ncbi:MAG: OFA family MFS transporter [Planctomycetes bacterium]|nr:OFA family MFS transporter [Planctomycetota bacterium]MBU4398621.1 OFA family MFS transporter [Planctomycetota bacterium]MCG2685609.1 OFA family MFS transporter [Planctomycetales bacterium]
MSEKRPMNRWLVVLGAILIQLCLGAIYAWSVFTPYLTKAPYGFSATQSQVVFSVGLASFAFVMILAGRMLNKFTPRMIAILGGLVMGSGYIAASFTGTNFIAQVLTIGLIGGAGIGLAYVVPIAVGVKWFPDKKGMLTGLAVAGFGFGALIWIKLAGGWSGFHIGETTLIAPFKGLIALLQSESHQIGDVFLWYGIAYAVIVLIGSIWMVNPPADYKPKGWNPPPPKPGGAATGAVNLTSLEMLRTPQFYGLWLMFAAGAMTGLMVIGCIALFGIDALRSTGLKEAAAKDISATAMGVFFALANGLGRIGWGMISDKLGRKASLFLMLASQGVVMLVFYSMGFNVWLFYLGATIVGFNFGGNFALFPAATADFFGNKNVGANYGWVFSSYGVGGIVGPILAGYFKGAAKGGEPSAWLTPFVIAGVACLAAAVLALLLKSPKHKDIKANT